MFDNFSLLSSSHLIGKVGSKRTHKADDKALRVISTTPLPIAYEFHKLIKSKEG